MIASANIPDGYLIALLAVLLPSMIALMAWIVKELGRISNANSVSEVLIAHLERKVNEQEAELQKIQLRLDRL